MSQANRCDRCGTFFVPTPGAHYMLPRIGLDLCPMCKTEFITWMREKNPTFDLILDTTYTSTEDEKK